MGCKSEFDMIMACEDDAPVDSAMGSAITALWEDAAVQKVLLLTAIETIHANSYMHGIGRPGISVQTTKWWKPSHSSFLRLIASRLTIMFQHNRIF